MTRLRVGEWLAAIGAAGLLVTLFLPWFGDAVSSSPWDNLGWVTIAFVLVTIAAGAWLVVATAVARPLAQLVAAAVLAATIGTFGFVVLALRVLVFQPGPNAVVTVRYGGYIGMLAALLVAVGGWWAIKDERTDAPASAYTPPPPRPAPPERAS